MKLTGAQALIKSLEMEGTEVMFGLPGGAILPVYDPLIDSSIRHILVRHEQGAGHMAEGFAHVDRSSGCGDGDERSGRDQRRHAAVRRLHGLHPDRDDHGPGAVLGDRYGRVPGVRHRRHHDAGDEAQLAGHRLRPTSRGSCARRSTSRRLAGPGPVLVDVPKDVANMEMDWYWPESVDLPGYKPNMKGHAKQIKDAARLMGEARRPVLYVGGGVLKARAAETLRDLAELTGFPVVTTLMARGAFPDDHELCLGMPGMHGNYTAVTAMQKADLLIALGSRFDDRVTGKVGAFAPDAKIIHVDIDPAELGKVAPAGRADRR